MAKFVNTNPHAVYVDDPDDDERDLTRVYPGEEVSASGAFADRLAATSGMLDTSSDAYDDYKARREGKLKTEMPEGEEAGGYGVDSPEVLAVGPDLEAAEPSKEDEEAEEAGRRAAEEERAADEEKAAKAAEKAEKKAEKKSGGTTTTAKVPKK